MSEDNSNIPAASNSPEPEDQTHKQNASTVPAITSGFLISHLAAASLILRAVHVAARLDADIKEVMHVPETRVHLARGFEILANTQGYAFKAFAEVWNYDVDKFYDACDAYLNKQNELMISMKQVAEGGVPGLQVVEGEQLQKIVKGQRKGNN